MKIDKLNLLDAGEDITSSFLNIYVFLNGLDLKTRFSPFFEFFSLSNEVHVFQQRGIN